MSSAKQRHYIHGDQLEEDPTLFYCASCDVFFPEEHFFGPDNKCCNHWTRYDEALKMLGNSPKKHREFGRPMNAVNVFTLPPSTT